MQDPAQRGSLQTRRGFLKTGAVALAFGGAAWAAGPDDVTIALISEAAPPDRGDYYYAPGDPLFQQTTVAAFRDAGADVASIQDILDLGVYLTTAVKCGKTGYGIKAGTIKECSYLLERELAALAP